MKTFASTLLAAALAVAAATPALSCPYSQNKQASLTDQSSYESAQNENSSKSQ